MSKMDSYDEMNHLQRRSKELQKIVCDLEDIKDWMVKNAREMQSEFLGCVLQLESAIEQVDSFKSLVDERATAMEQKVYSEPTT